MEVDVISDCSGTDSEKVSALAQSVRRTHAPVTAYIASLLEANAGAEAVAAHSPVVV